MVNNKAKRIAAALDLMSRARGTPLELRLTMLLIAWGFGVLDHRRHRVNPRRLRRAARQRGIKIDARYIQQLQKAIDEVNSNVE